MIKILATKLSAFRSTSANSAYGVGDKRDLKKNVELIKESGIFDFDFYNGQSTEVLLTFSEAISHFLNGGAENNLDPHPLFDTAFYIKTNLDINFDACNPLIHFITIGWQQGRDPHPLFDVRYYLNKYDDVRDSNINPLTHFILFGAEEQRDPCPFIKPDEYRIKIQEWTLRDYLARHFAEKKKISVWTEYKKTKIKEIVCTRTHPNIYQFAPNDWSRQEAKQVLVKKESKFFLWRARTQNIKIVRPYLQKYENPLLYFLSKGNKQGLLPLSSFALLYEIHTREARSVTSSKTTEFCKVVPRNFNNYQSLPGTYISFARRLNKANLSKEKFTLFKQLVQNLTFKKDAQGFLESKSTIILISHVASYTGAPMLLLQIARSLTERGWECLLLLDRPGELEKDFSEVAHVINFQESPLRYIKAEQFLSLLFDDLGFARPKVCLLNSMETGWHAEAISKQGIKNITLVHEIVDSYTVSYVRNVFDHSQSIIFPAKFINDFAQNKIKKTQYASKQKIIHTALLDDNFGVYDRTQARRLLRQEIDVPDNSLIILNCGSPDMRKGIDVFFFLSQILIEKWQQLNEQQPLHFVWVGADKISPFSSHYYLDWDLRRGLHTSQIHLLSSRKELRPIFKGADVFALTSRQDPFPCVVHNAMAAELPIVAFQDAGGVPEMLEGCGAKIIKYGDIIKFAEAIYSYLINEQARLDAGKLNARVVLERFQFRDYISKLEAEIKTVIRK